MLMAGARAGRRLPQPREPAARARRSAPQGDCDPPGARQRPRRIVRQLLVEGLTLSAIGAACRPRRGWWTTAGAHRVAVERRCLRHRLRRRAVVAAGGGGGRASRSSAPCSSRLVRRGPVANGSDERSEGDAQPAALARVATGSRCWSSGSWRCRWRWSRRAGSSSAPRSTRPSADAGFSLDRQLIVVARSEPRRLRPGATRATLSRGAASACARSRASSTRAFASTGAVWRRAGGALRRMSPGDDQDVGGDLRHRRRRLLRGARTAACCAAANSPAPKRIRVDQLAPRRSSIDRHLREQLFGDADPIGRHGPAFRSAGRR